MITPSLATEHVPVNDGLLNAVELATVFSQIAAVLAGFAFAGLMFLLRSPKRLRVDVVAPSLLSAFTTLILVAVLYGLLAGETPSRAAALRLIMRWVGGPSSEVA